MNNKVTTLILKCLVLLFICCLCTMISDARIAANWRECANTPGCTDDGSTSILSVYSTSGTEDGSILILRAYIVESAGHFLNSHSDFQKLLNYVEMADTKGIEYSDLKVILYNTIESMEKAKAAYYNLKALSNKIPYNQKMIIQLKIFDYNGFQVKCELIESIFVKLKTLLVKGDIAGFDKAVIANMDNILCKLYEIKASVDKDQFPEITLLWRANQAYSEAQLFAQYMSEVFRAILF